MLLRALLALGVALGLAAAPAQAGFRDTCALEGGVRVCTGMVESFDGTPLDTTLTLPPRVKKGKRLPLVVFIHGFLSNKSEYIAKTATTDFYKTAELNNVRFASRGYAVLNYSARGHGESGGQIGLASKHVETLDSHHLTGMLVDDGTADRRRVAAIGGSYGGGQTWLLMTVKGKGAPQYGTWRSPKGRVVRLAAAVPQFTWTDLLFSLIPNGRSPVTPTPLGVPKSSLLNGFIALIGTKMTPDIARWLGRMNTGEPYDGDPVVEEAKKALTEERSAYYQDGFFKALRRGRKHQRSIPVLAAQGWTDPIFPAVEAVRMYKRLREIRRGYPIGMYFGDFEHLTSQIKVPDMRYYHRLANRMLDHFLRGKGRRPRFDVRSAPTICDPEKFGPVVRARDWGRLHPAAATIDFEGPRSTASPLNDPRGPATDHVVLGLQRRGCVTTDQPETAGVATWRAPVGQAFTLIGDPRLDLVYSTVGTDVQLNVRLWDVAPDGVQTLVTRGVYRLVEPLTGEQKLSYDLYGNHWRFEAGHELMLEVTSDDSPFFRRDNFPSTTTISSARLTLPGRR